MRCWWGADAETGVPPVFGLFCELKFFAQRSRIHLAPFSRREIIEAHGADGDADEAQGGMSGGGRHASHLTVAAFSEDYFEPRGGDKPSESDRWYTGLDVRLRIGQSHFAGAATAIREARSGAQRLQCRRARRAFDLGPIGSRVTKPRAKEALNEWAIVRQNKEAFAIRIEATGGIHVGWKSEFRERALSGGAGELAQHAVWFVKREIAIRSRSAGPGCASPCVHRRPSPVHSFNARNSASMFLVGVGP